ncbi:MAG TPA: SigE family RNA polymerase sigma factor [Actinomycetota bacterium]|nr:SigE family RNA polymerase sigma factor [Actinomycetota bacterium]
MVVDAIADDAKEPRRLDLLYREYVGQLTRTAYLLTGDKQAAQDLAHEAFVRTSSRIYTLRNPEAFGAYVTRVVVNLCKRHRSRRFLERRHLEQQAHNVSASEMQPDLEAKDEVVRCLRKLPHRQRAAIVLRYYADQSESQIAQTLGCSTGNVKSLISRGLSKLRSELEPER